MKITIDYNSDKLYINPDERYEKSDAEFDIRAKILSPVKIEKILDEIFNRLPDSNLASATPYFDVELERISEDTRTTIGEW